MYRRRRPVDRDWPVTFGYGILFQTTHIISEFQTCFLNIPLRLYTFMYIHECMYTHIYALHNLRGVYKTFDSDSDRYIF